MLIFVTLKLVVLGTKPMDRPVLLHAPRYYKYLQIVNSSFKLNLGIRGYDRKTDQKIQIVCVHRGGPITRCAFTLTLRAGCEHIFQLYKPHPRNKYQMKLRGSAAPEQKNTKIHQRNGPLKANFFAFLISEKCSFS